MTTDLPSFSTCDALVSLMVAVSASDENMRTSELVAIERMVDHMPVFAAYDVDRIRVVSQTVITLFEEEDGIEALFGLVRDALPERLYETAYALCCDVAAAWRPSASCRDRTRGRVGRARPSDEPGPAPTGVGARGRATLESPQNPSRRS